MAHYNLRSSAQKAPVESVESWDDDADIQGFEGLQLRQSSTISARNKSSPRHRDRASSRLSSRSGEDNENDWQLLVGDDDASNAIRNAHNAGVPIPKNVPASALMGGTIKKLGTKKKPSKDNYDDDIDFPAGESHGLKLSLSQSTEYPPVLRSSSGNTLQFRTPPETPTRPSASKGLNDNFSSLGMAQTNPALAKFRDEDDEEEDVFGDCPTIKVGKVRNPLKSAGFYAMPQGTAQPNTDDDLMDGIEIPQSGLPLKLSARKETPITPVHMMPADLEVDTRETTLGNGQSYSFATSNSRPSGRSERSSSVTAHSPSVFSPTLSSSFTAESEEDGLEGLVLPDGPVNFGEALKRRLESVSPDPSPTKKTEMQAPPKDDFFEDLDIDDGRIFDSGKLRVNRNVKLNQGKRTSPSRKGATTITFTNRPSSVTTRIPKPSPLERPHSKMETISENGPAYQSRRSQSRLVNHSTQSSMSSLPTPTAPAVPASSGPPTPTKRSLATRSSTQSMRQDTNTTTSAQLLKAKRSLPMLRNQPSPSRPQSMYARPPSQTERQRPVINRPKTPNDSSSTSKNQVPFIPPGSTKGSSHHVSTRSSRNMPRSNSNESNEPSSLTGRPSSRLSNGQLRPRTPSFRPDVAPEALARQAVVKRPMTKPWTRKAFGDGTELDGFDDLVTSREQEAKFFKQPREGQATPTLRSANRPSGDLRKHYSAQSLNAATSTPSEHKTPLQAQVSPPRVQQQTIPSFARDTAASRLAREQRVARLNPQPNRRPHASDSNLNSRFKDQLSVKAAIPPARQLRRTKKPKQPLNLIKNLGGNAEIKPEKGMHYNAKECKWEGNEAALASFDTASVDRKKTSTPSNGQSSPSRLTNNSTPKPALIAPLSQKRDIAHQVGGMVFDPVRMCWLKVDAKHQLRPRHDTLRSTSLSAGSTGRGARSVTTAATEDEEEDPFAGIADLEDERKVGTGAGARKSEERKRSISGTGTGGAGAADASSDDDWGIGEDFDVGPEFVRRQKKEDQRLRRKLAVWVNRQDVKPETEEELFAERMRMTMLLCS